MKSFTLVAAATLVLCCSTAGFAKNKEISDRDQEQAACYDDAQRLCPDTMPDVDKTIECMKPKKKLVSAKCAAFYK